MKLGVFTVLFADRPFEEALDRIAEAGLDCVEIGTGNYPGDAHCDAPALLADDAKLRAFREAVTSRGLEISALSCHGNPLHPQREVAAAAHDVFLRTVELAERLEVDRINLFSGCPGDSDTARFPNWVTCAWPNEFGELLEWQWSEKVIPYWGEQAAFATQHGVKLGFEMHPGFVVHNPRTLLRLRDACGEAIGANLDPSHLFWQGIDVEMAIAELGKEGAIFHTHAKDTAIHPRNAGAERRIGHRADGRGRTIARGSSAPSGTATVSSNGDAFSARCGWLATTASSRSSTRTRSSRSTRDSTRASPSCEA